VRQNNVDFQNGELPANILALLLVTTRRVTPDDARRHQEQTAIARHSTSAIGWLLRRKWPLNIGLGLAV
jgi:hypothetical protein